MALLMMTAKIKPEAPSSAPATINTLLSRTKPRAAAERPAYAFSMAITVGMSAPPIAMTRRNPKMRANAAMMGRINPCVGFRTR